MKLTLPRFGVDEVEIDPATLIEFPAGLPGFEDCRQFKLFHSENNSAIFWLQSIDDPSVVFSITGPETLGVFYKMTLSDEELGTLQAQADDDLQVAILLGAQDELEAGGQKNVQAYYESPIIINVSRQLAVQKTLHFADFSIDACGAKFSEDASREAAPAHFTASNARYVEHAAA